MKNFYNLNIFLQRNVKFDNKDLKTINNFIKTLIDLTNCYGLIIYDSSNKIRLILDVTSFVEIYIVQHYINNEPLSSNEILNISQDFFLNWNNDLTFKNLQQPIPTSDVADWLTAIFQDKIFLKKVQNAYMSSWPALFLNIETDIFDKTKIKCNVELFQNQILFDFETIKKIFNDMEEGGLLCKNSLQIQQTIFKNNALLNNKVEFYCKRNLNLTEEQNQQLWIKKIKRWIIELSFSKNIYHEIFDFVEQKLSKNELTNKIIFKLNKILIEKYPEMPYKIFFKKNDNDFVKKIYNIGLILNLKLCLFDKKITKKIIEKNIFFKWTKKIINQKVVNLLINKIPRDEAIIELTKDELLKINKNFFYQNIDNKGVNFYNFVLSVLFDLSEEFSIYSEDNLNENLKNIKCHYVIRYKNRPVYDVDFLENKTIVYKKDKSTFKIIKSWEQKNLPNPPALYNKETTIDIWKKVVKILHNNFQGVWFKNDNLYEFTQTMKNLLQIINGKKFAENVQIIGSFKPSVKLSKLLKHQIINGQKKQGVAFDIAFNSYNFKFIINTYEFELINIINSNWKLFFIFWNKVVNVFLGKNSFLKTNKDLLIHLRCLLLEVTYQFDLQIEDISSLNLSFKEFPFVCDIVTEDYQLFKIELQWQKLRWAVTVSYYDEYDYKEDEIRT